jgi:long-chain acyl-CoA synthetase
MREIDVPAVTVIDPGLNLTDVIVTNAREVPDSPSVSRPGPGGWSTVTASELLQEVTGIAKGLIAAGVSPGDRVALLARTRYEWTLSDLAIWFAGAVTVPVYETSSPEQVRWILSDSQATAIIVESAPHRDTVQGLRDGLPALREVWTIDDDGLGTLRALGVPVSDDDVEQRRRTLNLDSIATLIYTSGTTGRPKGCELTHGNFLRLAHGAHDVFGDLVTGGKSTLLFLPLAHVFARFVQVLCLVNRSTLAHSPTVTTLLDDLGAFQPTFLLAVPRVFEKIYNSAEAKAQAGGKGPIFAAAAATAIEYSKALDTGGAGLVLKAKHLLFDRLVYGKLRAATGGRVEAAISGGAPLGPRLGHFFRGIGLPIMEGWGLTETTAPATVNTPTQNKIGSVGRPLPGVAIRVASDGELQIRGAGVLHGYYNNPEATSQAIDADGWFSSGDLGEIDDDGFVKITGRKKEILVTAGGKNVIPAVLEDALRAHPLISQCIVVGDQRPFIGCLITLDPEMLGTWLSSRNKPALSVERAATDPDVLAELQKAVDAANAQVSKAESIRKFAVLHVDFTEQDGHLTPKLSLKRAVVMKEFAAHVEGLYASSNASSSS